MYGGVHGCFDGRDLVEDVLLELLCPADVAIALCDDDGSCGETGGGVGALIFSSMDM